MKFVCLFIAHKVEKAMAQRLGEAKRWSGMATSTAESTTTMIDEISRDGNEKCLKSHSSRGDCSKVLRPKLAAIESVESGMEKL